jgi:hypothetical protein
LAADDFASAGRHDPVGGAGLEIWSRMCFHNALQNSFSKLNKGYFIHFQFLLFIVTKSLFCDSFNKG